MFWLQIQSLALCIAPLPEAFDDRFAALGSRLLFVRAFEVFLSNPGFLFVQPGNQHQPFLGLGIVGFGGFELPSCVGPALRVSDTGLLLRIADISAIAVSQQ